MDSKQNDKLLGWFATFVISLVFLVNLAVIIEHWTEFGFINTLLHAVDFTILVFFMLLILGAFFLAFRLGTEVCSRKQGKKKKSRNNP